MGDEVDFFCSQINTKVFYKLRVSFWMCVARNAQTTQNNKFKMSLHYLKENVKDEVDFLPGDKRQRFLQIETIVLGVCGQFISLQYLKKEVSDEFDFLYADKHESLLQIDIMVLMGMFKCSQSSQNGKFAKSLQYLKKLFLKLIFCMQIDISFLQVDFNTFGIEVSYKVILSLLMGMIKHSQSTQSNKFSISLQYLEKEIRSGVHFKKLT